MSKEDIFSYLTGGGIPDEDARKLFGKFSLLLLFVANYYYV